MGLVTRVAGNGSRSYLPLFVTLTPQGSCYGPQRGPKHEPCVHAGPVGTPRPNALETTRSWRDKYTNV